MNNDVIASAATPQSTSEEIHSLFARLQPQDVEQFYQSFQHWTLQRQIETLQIEIAALKEAIAENAVSLEETRPSAIALATLAQLQSRGVDDLDLLDKMLERGESWLDHTMQLLAYCERFGVMRGNYTEWCEHALEGAYDWIRSMKEAGTTSMPPRTPGDHEQRFDEATEALLLQKLMSEGEETIKMPSIARERAKITQPLTERKITRPLAQRKITQPLGETELAPEDSAAPADEVQETTPSADVTEIESESAVIVGEPLPGDDTEAPTAAVVVTPEGIERDTGSTEQAEEGAATTEAEPEAAVVVVTEPGNGVSEPETTGVVTEPEPPAEEGKQGDQAVQETTEVVALQEVEHEVSIPTASHAGEVQAPQSEAGTEDSTEDAARTPAVGAQRAAASKPAPDVDDETVTVGPADIIEQPSGEPASMDAAHPELEDTRPLQKITASPPETVERVEAASSETESAEPAEEAAPAAPGDDISQAETVPEQRAASPWQGVAWPTPQPGPVQARSEQRPRKRRRFFLWRWLARLWRR